MTTPKRRYIDELEEGIKFSSGGPVSISLETAKRLLALYDNFRWSDDVNPLEDEMPEPKP